MQVLCFIEMKKAQKQVKYVNNQKSEIIVDKYTTQLYGAINFPFFFPLPFRSVFLLLSHFLLYTFRRLGLILSSCDRNATSRKTPEVTSRRKAIIQTDCFQLHISYPFVSALNNLLLQFSFCISFYCVVLRPQTFS